MVVGTTSRSSRGKGKVGKRSAKGGKIIAKFFNELAGRPYRAIGSLEQSISVTLCASAALSTTSTVVATFASVPFTLNMFGGYVPYVSLFDQYRFDLIEVWVEPIAAQGSAVYRDVASCVDRISPLLAPRSPIIKVLW